MKVRLTRADVVEIFERVQTPMYFGGSVNIMGNRRSALSFFNATSHDVQVCYPSGLVYTVHPGNFSPGTDVVREGNLHIPKELRKVYKGPGLYIFEEMFGKPDGFATPIFTTEGPRQRLMTELFFGRGTVEHVALCHFIESSLLVEYKDGYFVSDAGVTVSHGLVPIQNKFHVLHNGVKMRAPGQAGVRVVVYGSSSSYSRIFCRMGNCVMECTPCLDTQFRDAVRIFTIGANGEETLVHEGSIEEMLSKGVVIRDDLNFNGELRFFTDRDSARRWQPAFVADAFHELSQLRQKVQGLEAENRGLKEDANNMKRRLEGKVLDAEDKARESRTSNWTKFINLVAAVWKPVAAIVTIIYVYFKTEE